MLSHSSKELYSFRIAYKSEDEVKTLEEQQAFDPSTLILTILPDGQPSFKDLYTLAASEEEATTKMDAYVSVTPYKLIENHKII